MAGTTFNRIKKLFQKKSVSQQEFDHTRTTLTQARSRVTQAESQIQSLQAKKNLVDGKPVYRLVKTSRVVGDQVEVLSGLQPGNRFQGSVPQR